MIELESYVIHSQEVSFIKRWFELRNLDLNLKDLPEQGVLITCSDRPVAVGFLRKCEGNYALIDSCITNPLVQAEIRDKAMNLLAKELTNLTKSLGITKLLAFSIDENTLIRSQSFGFKRLPYAVIALDLTHKEG